MLSDVKTDSLFLKDILLQPIKVDASIVLKNLFFDINEFKLKQASASELDRVVKLLTDNPSVKILIAGHTDSDGNEAANKMLSENRAKEVVSYLIRKGVKQNRLTSKGFGATQPIDSNLTETGKANNRRTELKIIAK